jgi:hypothetical protein
MAAQTYKNHARFDPKFHFFLIPLCLICFIMSIVHAVHQHTPANVLLVPVTFSIMFLALVARMYSIKVQDRVIRLEENVRLHALGVDPSGLTLRQMIALRFASDAESPALAARAVAEKMTPKQIKEAIVNWRADLDRV